MDICDRISVANQDCDGKSTAKWLAMEFATELASWVKPWPLLNLVTE